MIDEQISAEPIRVITLRELLTVERPPMPCWIGSRLLPKGAKLLLGGLPKIGKTYVLLEMARAIITGTDVFDSPLFPTEQGRVLMIDQEVGEDGMDERARTQMLEYVASLGDELGFVFQEPRLKLDTIEGLNALYQLCCDFRPNVLFLDPMGQMHNGNENDASEIGRVLGNVSKLQRAFRDTTQMGIVMSHHFNKGSGRGESKALDPRNFRGTGKWFDVVDAMLMLDRPVDEVVGTNGWPLESAYITRHGSAISNKWLTVNRYDDFRVRIEQGGKPATTKLSDEPAIIDPMLLAPLPPPYLPMGTPRLAL